VCEQQQMKYFVVYLRLLLLLFLHVHPANIHKMTVGVRVTDDHFINLVIQPE